MTKERLAFAWHLLDFVVAVVGLGWSVYHLTRPRLVETARHVG